MPTVYERIKASRFLPSAEQKIQIGKAIAEAYFKQPKKYRPPLAKQKSVEPNGTYVVWVYPKRFTKQMDRVIFTLCAGTPKLKRKRIVKTK